MSPSVEPFNEAKYKALMDGLECSEIKKSELEFSGRIDAEYYQKKHLQYQNIIKAHNALPLCKVANFLIGPFGSAYDTGSYIEESGYRYIRGQDVKPFLLQDLSPKYMKESDYVRLNKYALNANDILVSVVGTLGNACIIQEHEIPAIFSCKSTAIKAISVNPFYLVSYLNSKYGRCLLTRKERGAIQKGLNLDDLKTLEIPLFSDLLYKNIEILIRRAFESIGKAKQIYTECEEKLCEIVGNPAETGNKLYSIKTLKNSFLVSGRLDAEYYQPKFDTLFDELKKFSTKRLGGNAGIVSIKKSIEPGTDAYKDEGIPFVRVSDISKYEMTSPEIHLSPDIVEDVEALFPKKDTILFSKDGSVGIAYKLERDENIITSSALLHLTIKNTSEVLPDYLTLVLNSPVVQMQAERDTNGAIIQHWKPSEIENVIIPILDMDKQKELSEMVQKSFALRCQSKQLLEYAKQAVEMAIEQGETEALTWLTEKTGE